MNSDNPSTSHSIVRFIVIAIVFMLAMSIALLASEILFGRAKNHEIDVLQSDIEDMSVFISATGSFSASYSDYLRYRDQNQADGVLRSYSLMMQTAVKNPHVFSLSDNLALYYRIISQTASSMFSIFNESLMKQVMTEEDYEVIQRLEVGIQYLSNASDSLSTEFIIHTGNRISEISRKYDAVSRIQTIILLLCIPVTIIWFYVLYSNVIKGIRVLNEGTGRLSKKEWDMPDLPLTSVSEINNSIEAINLMKKTIVEYIDALEEHLKVTELLAEKTIETERQKRLIQETQFNLLQAQINPHFLFNTLNMVVNNVRAKERLDETANVLVATSRLLRSSIELKSPVIPLNEELRLLDSYITIQKARNEDRIVICMIVHGDIPQVDIPPFSLQPLVENSIVHGLRDRTENGYIEIQIFSDDEGGAMIQLHDNGKGIPEDVVRSVCDGTIASNGLGNVIRRLKMIYGNDDIIEFAKSREGTTIVLHLDSKARREFG